MGGDDISAVLSKVPTLNMKRSDNRLQGRKFVYQVIVNVFNNQNISSIKQDLARSCFQLWPIIGDEGGKIEKK